MSVILKNKMKIKQTFRWLFISNRQNNQYELITRLLKIVVGST